MGSPLPLTKSVKEGPALSLSLNVVVLRLLGVSLAFKDGDDGVVELVVA